MKHVVWLALCVSAVSMGHAQAAVYKCVGEDGKIRYSNTGCPGKRAEKVIEQDSGSTSDSPESLALQNVVQRCDLESAVILNQQLEAQPDDMMKKRARSAYKQCANKAREAKNDREALDWEAVRQGGNPYLVPGRNPVEIMLEKQQQAVEKQEMLEQQGSESP